MAYIDGGTQVSIRPIERPLNLIPVGLKEAALDSPTFRATTVHFADQIEAVERWLEGYVKAASRLTTEISQFETIVNSFINQTSPPAGLSEAVIDHDYALIAMRRFGEGARESWTQTLKGVKRYDVTIIDPIRSFLHGELRAFKEARRVLDVNQKAFDSAISRYLAQSKTKEASSLREDAFQVHEARKAYLKASMDLSVAGPLLRDSFDKLLVKIATEQWREMRISREAAATTISRLNGEMERVRGWSKEMENSERAFRRELMEARKQIEESASQMIKPSRELADYEMSTVPYIGTAASAAPGMLGSVKPRIQKGEKQGWLFLKTIVGKPARTVWSRRWFFVKNGIFGWLVQGARSGGVEESEKIGVLLCGVKPAFQEERRFCFEVKTKDTNIILQAETQAELSEWISTFEISKRKALEDPRSVETSPLSPGLDPAFAVTPPISPEFAAKIGEGSLERAEDGTNSLSAPDRDATGGATRASFDVGAAARRVTSLEKEPEGSREHAARLMQKLDLHKRGPLSPQSSQPAAPMGGGIASLISASHTIFPVGPGAPVALDGAKKVVTGVPPSSLTPSTLANPPAPTNLSHTAVLVSSERGFSLGGRGDGSGIPGGIMANLWGSSNWAYVNRLGDDAKTETAAAAAPSTPPILAGSVDDIGVTDGTFDSAQKADESTGVKTMGSPRHRKTMSAANTSDLPLPGQLKSPLEEVETYPSYYPLSLKAQHAQFRILFPSVPRTEKLVLVFRATWNPNEQQEFPGRVYVTDKEIYFYSHYLGLVLITGVSLTSIAEVTAAPGRDCDFLYLLLKENPRQNERRRITVRVFLDSLRLLQRRLAFLVENSSSKKPGNLEDIIGTLIKMETEVPKRSTSADSWEELTYDPDDNNATDPNSPGNRRQRNIKASLRIDGDLYGDASKTGREIQRFQLPRQPVIYAPQGMQSSITREFNVSAKALFHVMFGDKSAVFQSLYCNRWADKIIQSPWVKEPGISDSRWTRRFASEGNITPMADTQMIDIMNDHLCYVVTHNKRPWRLPYSNRFHLITKFVITHAAKSKSKLAIFQQVAWNQSAPPTYLKKLVEKQALNSLEADALDLTTVAMDQVNKLGNHSKTNKAIEIFGNIGTQQAITQLDPSSMPNLGGSAAAARIKARRPVGVVKLVASDVLVRLLSMLNMLFDLAIAVGKGVLKICSTHTLLVLMLVASSLYNGWYGYRDGLLWWHERNASKYMARLGVKPEPTISRAVYLTDIEEMVRPSNANEFLGASVWNSSDVYETRTCRTTFEELLTNRPPPDSSAAAEKLHRSRNALAKNRHDLLVALRVLNRVERDIVSAEWEEWVRGEERNCGRVEDLIRRQMVSQQGTGSAVKTINNTELDNSLGKDFAVYCASCRHELNEIGFSPTLI